MEVPSLDREVSLVNQLEAVYPGDSFITEYKDETVRGFARMKEIFEANSIIIINPYIFRKDDYLIVFNPENKESLQKYVANKLGDTAKCSVSSFLDQNLVRGVRERNPKQLKVFYKSLFSVYFFLLASVNNGVFYDNLDIAHFSVCSLKVGENFSKAKLGYVFGGVLKNYETPFYVSISFKEFPLTTSILPFEFDINNSPGDRIVTSINKFKDSIEKYFGEGVIDTKLKIVDMMKFLLDNM